MDQIVGSSGEKKINEGIRWICESFWVTVNWLDTSHNVWLYWADIEDYDWGGKKMKGVSSPVAAEIPMPYLPFHRFKWV